MNYGSQLLDFPSCLYHLPLTNCALKCYVHQSWLILCLRNKFINGRFQWSVLTDQHILKVPLANEQAITLITFQGIHRCLVWRAFWLLLRHTYWELGTEVNVSWQQWVTICTTPTSHQRPIIDPTTKLSKILIHHSTKKSINEQDHEWKDRLLEVFIQDETYGS